jgi:hypothetical protein
MSAPSRPVIGLRLQDEPCQEGVRIKLEGSEVRGDVVLQLVNDESADTIEITFQGVLGRAYQALEQKLTLRRHMLYYYYSTRGNHLWSDVGGPYRTPCRFAALYYRWHGLIVPSSFWR